MKTAREKGPEMLSTVIKGHLGEKLGIALKKSTANLISDHLDFPPGELRSQSV